MAATPQSPPDRAGLRSLGSVADLVVVTDRAALSEQVNDVFCAAAQTPCYRHVLGVSEDPQVCADILGDTHAAVVDLDLPLVVDGTLVKTMAWYDNQIGFTHPMVRAVRAILDARVAALATRPMTRQPLSGPQATQVRHPGRHRHEREEHR